MIRNFLDVAKSPSQKITRFPRDWLAQSMLEGNE